MIEQASKLISPSQLSLLKLGLSLHVYSPKVQMFQQIAVERNLPACGATVVDVNGHLTCDKSQLIQLINNVIHYFINYNAINSLFYILLNSIEKKTVKDLIYTELIITILVLKTEV